MIVTDKVVKNLRKNNNKVIARTFKGATFNRNEIKQLVKQFQEKYKNKDLQLMLSINTPFGFRSAKTFDIYEEPNLVEDYEWEKTNSFIIYGWNKSAPVGGNNEKNDCLYQCIKQLVSIYRLPKGLKTDLDLKKALSLKPYDKIPLSLLPQVCQLYKININVSGDYSFTSLNKYKQTIHLTLINEHYEIVKDNLKKKSLLNHIPHKEQKLIYILFQDTNIKCYDGNEIFYMSFEEYNGKRNDFNGEYVYLDDLPIGKSDFIKDYHLFIEEVEKLKEFTNGKIDLAKSGYKISNEALKCVHYSLLSFHEPEAITLQEQEWFYNSFKGGLIFCENNKTLDYGYNYDKKSAYPSILCSDHFSFPVKAGEFKILNELPDILQYGIYKCKIEPSTDENINKLFRFNNKNYYNHYDLNLAKKLELKIQLSTNETNALVYIKDRANGSMYFRQVVHSLYELKTKSKLAKKVLNAIWGALSQRNKIKTTTTNEINLKNGELLIDIKEMGEDLHKITYLNGRKFFKHSYARLGCFLTSAVRKHMAEIIYPYRENVFKCHTDSILSDIELPELLIGDNLGDFKLENHGKVHIHHSSKSLEWL